MKVKVMVQASAASLTSIKGSFIFQFQMLLLSLERSAELILHNISDQSKVTKMLVIKTSSTR